MTHNEWSQFTSIWKYSSCKSQPYCDRFRRPFKSNDSVRRQSIVYFISSSKSHCIGKAIFFFNGDIFVGMTMFGQLWNLADHQFLDHWLEAVDFFMTSDLAASTADPDFFFTSVLAASTAVSGFRFLGGFSRLLSMVSTAALASFLWTEATVLERAASEEGLFEATLEWAWDALSEVELDALGASAPVHNVPVVN